MKLFITAFLFPAAILTGWAYALSDIKPKPRHILMKCYDNQQSRDNGIANATATLIQFGYYPDGYLRITNSPGMYCFEMGVVDAE